MGSEPSDPNDIETLQRQIAELQAKLSAAQHGSANGSGAVAQGGGDALGKVDGDIGTTVTGTQNSVATHGGAVVDGALQVSNGHFIGRDVVQFITQAAPASEDTEEAKSVIALYLHALTSDLAGLKLGAIDASSDQTRRSPLQLADIYVPLDTRLRIPREMTLTQRLSRDPHRQSDETDAQREMRPVSALEALVAHRKLTVLGKPGSGKTTFGASVLLKLAQAWQGHGGELASLGESWKYGALLPIRIILRRFAEQLPPDGKKARAGDLWRFIGHDLDASGYGLSTEAMKYVQRIARTSGALILLDGLDECGDSAARERVLGAVHELMRTAGEQCRFVLTARPYAWPGGPDADQGVYALADLDDDKVEQFIRAWYAALVKRSWRSPGDADRKMADLYDESVDLLMLRWNEQIGADKALLDALGIAGLKLSDLREVLEELAFKVHKSNVGREGTADVGEDRLVRAFCPLLNDSKDKADVVVDYIEKCAGLLIGQGEKDGERQFTFPHRTFQEFLAACQLAAMDDFPAECARLARMAAAHWSEALPLAARLAKAERGASAADEMVGGTSVKEFRSRRQPNEVEWTCALLAGLQLREIGLGAINKRDRTRAIAARVAGWLAASLPVHPKDGGPPSRQRAQAGDVLAALGDPRFDPQRSYLPADDSLGFVRISADPEFKIGTRKSDVKRVAEVINREVFDDEINDTVTPTQVFYIARYPVTVAQFRAFVETTGFEVGNPASLRDPDSRPVRYVSWHEALAYCDWLNEKLADPNALDGGEMAHLVREHGWRVAMPSELEWEKSARGGLQQPVFSWGDTPDGNRANYNESEIGDTSVVGCFPANSFGLYDMIGSVWEWTRSLWGTELKKPDFGYPYEPDDPKREDLDVGNEMRRVVRGGSWLFNRVAARCAYRYRYLPGSRGSSLGFRVVLRSSPVA